MKFDVVYIDPPWEFANKKTGGSMKSGAEQKYPTMPLGNVLSLPIPALCKPNAAVFLWVPSRLKFSHGAACMAAWGLSYEATIYWDKQRLGMGFWFRNQVEELLVATRGDVEPFGCQLPNIIHAPALAHSEKPEEFRRMIEAATGKFSRRQCVEVFARRRAQGWTSLGAAITRRDIRDDIRRVAANDFEFEPVPEGLKA